MRREVLEIAARELRQRDRRVDVVERGQSFRGFGDPFAYFHAVRHVRADDDQIGVADVPRVAMLQLREPAVNARLAIRRRGEIAIVRVPRRVALEKENVMPPLRQLAHQPAIRRRVAIAPTRGDGEAEDDDVHGVARSPGRPAARCSTGRLGDRVTAPRISATCRARCAYVWCASTRLNAASPITRARWASSDSRISATSAPSFATSTSRPGSRKNSIPSQASVMRQAAAPAASKTRVAGDQPFAAIESREMLSTARGVQLKALWSCVKTCPA